MILIKWLLDKFFGKIKKQHYPYEEPQLTREEREFIQKHWPRSK